MIRLNTSISNKIYQSNNGQLAIGLAFIFMAFLALFSMIFQSSLLVREKIKLQQSVDYAALTGAQIQRAALDKIHDINSSILTDYYTTLALLNLPDCAILLAAGTSPYTVTNTAFNITQDPTALTDCSTACNAFEKYKHNKIIDSYNFIRQKKAEQIMNIIANTNGLTHEHVVNQIIHPNNLPQRLRYQVQQKLGKNPDMNTIKSSLKEGFLHQHLRITSTGDMNLPLFIPSSVNPQNDTAVFQFSKYTLNTVRNTGYTDFCTGPVFNGIDIKPTKTVIGRHPGLNESWPSHYAVMAMYNPPNSSVEGKFNLKVKNPNNDENTVTSDHNSINLMPNFESQSPRRWPMLVASLAKPFGGKFPKAALQSMPHGNAGKKFEGSKLIGFADYQNELEGHTPIIPLLEEISDKFGIEMNWSDILH